MTPEQSQDSSFALELRVWDNAVVPFGIEAVTLRQLGESDSGVMSIGSNRWLKMMHIGPAGSWQEGAIQIRLSMPPERAKNSSFALQLRV